MEHDPGSRRGRPRARVQLRADCIVLDGPRRGRLAGALRDLSLEGAQLELPEPLPVGTPVELRFRTGLVTGRVKVRGEVRASVREGDAARVHVRFERPVRELEPFLTDAILDEVAHAEGPLLGPARELETAAPRPRPTRLHTAAMAWITVRSEEGEAQGKAVILSVAEGGARLCTLDRIPRAAAVELAFRPSPLSKKIVASGTVRWSRRRGELFEAGVAFVEPVAAIRELVAGEEAPRARPPGEAGLLELLRQGDLPSFRPPGRFDQF